MAAADVVYTTDVSGLSTDDLQGFFADWPSRPSPERHLAILRGSDRVVLARERNGGRVIGFVTAISDGVLSAFIPLLEVVPGRRGQGIGTELVRRMLDELRDFYMVDLVCDPQLEGFYRRFEMTLLSGMAVRRRHLLDAE